MHPHPRPPRTTRAFTILEMLVAMSVLMILLGIIFYTYTNLFDAGTRAVRLIEMHDKARLFTNKVEELIMNRAPTMAFVAEDRHYRYTNLFAIDSAYDDNSTVRLWGTQNPNVTLNTIEGPTITSGASWQPADEGGRCWSVPASGPPATRKTKLTRYRVDGIGNQRSYGRLIAWSPVAAEWNSNRTAVTDRFTTVRYKTTPGQGSGSNPRRYFNMATPMWEPNQSERYEYGETVCDPADLNHNDQARRYIYMCISKDGGRSGPTRPDFPKEWGATVTESTGLQWMCVPPHVFLNADVDFNMNISTKRATFDRHSGMTYGYLLAPSVFLTGFADVWIETGYMNPVPGIDTDGADGLRGRWNRDLNQLSYYGNDPRGGEMPGHPRWVRIKFTVVGELVEGQSPQTLEIEQNFHTRF